jgi:hypothetical protein
MLLLKKIKPKDIVVIRYRSEDLLEGISLSNRIKTDNIKRPCHSE